MHIKPFFVEKQFITETIIVLTYLTLAFWKPNIVYVQAKRAKLKKLIDKVNNEN